MKTPNTHFRKRLLAARRRGATLLETAMVLMVISLLLVFYVSMQQGETDRILAKNTADKMATIGEAAKGYLSANYSKLLATAPAAGAQVVEVGRTTAGGPVPKGSLQDLGFLPPGFIDANGFNQNTALLVRKINATTLDAMLTTYGGREIPDRMLGTAAKLIGPAGGYVPASYPLAAEAGDILGIGGGWRSDAAQWGAAKTRPDTGTIQMTMNFEDGSLLKDYLYRNDVGNPAANRMNTDIDMNKRALNNTGKITGVTDAVSGGGKAVIIGDSTDRNSLRATRDIWADYDVRAKRDVRADRDVTAVRNVTAGNNVVATNLVQGNNVSAKKNAAGAGGNVAAAGNLTAGGNVTASGNLGVAGNATVSGTLKAGTINLDSRVVATEIDGTSRAFPAGVTLADLIPRTVNQYSYLVGDGGLIPKPTCRGGYGRARIMVYRQVDTTKTIPNVPLTVTKATVNGQSVVGGVVVDRAKSWVQFTQGVVAKDNGKTWQINWIGDPKADNTTRQALAQTSCFYDAG